MKFDVRNGMFSALFLKVWALRLN